MSPEAYTGRPICRIVAAYPVDIAIHVVLSCRSTTGISGGGVEELTPNLSARSDGRD